jgi:hypothetical protein
MATTVEGPITGGSHGWPFGATAADLAAAGYVEEEYFVSGEAPRYAPVGELGIDGRWIVEQAGTTPFATRAVVRRPVDANRFDGTVVVEWNNVSAGSDIFEVGDTPAFFEEGFAYVGVTTQRVGLVGYTANPQGLYAWDPDRYGALHIADDAISYGVFNGVARAFAPDRVTTPLDPLRGLPVRRLLAVGGSQSAGRLVTYVNAVHPLEHVFDGFILFTWFGSGASVDDPSVLDLSAQPDLSRITSRPTRVRDDSDVPVMVVNSECETVSCVPVRQPDTDRFRFWEVAGAPHGPRLHMERILAKMMRDGMAPPGGAPIDLTALSPVPWAPVLDAALVHMDRWIQGGPPPPHQPLIEVDLVGGQARVRRDGYGNALGGARVPEMEATRTRNIGAMEEAGAGGLLGATSPLPDEVLCERYPDHEAYLATFSAAAERAVTAGILRPSDADAAVEQARLD